MTLYTINYSNLNTRTAIIMLLAMLFSSGIMAQNGVVKGSVKGLNKEDFPVVNLLSAADSTLIKTTICDETGAFQIDLIRPGNYFLNITHIGYQTYTGNSFEITEKSAPFIFNNINLNAASIELKSAEITAKKSFVERKIDRVIVNPDALISNAGATSLEILEKSPGILVDIEGNISLKGKQGVMVFIDDKPTYLSSSDLAGYLRSLPGGSVELIEIMSNPPAKYDASGNAGIINIKLKRNVNRGLNGGVNLSYGQGRYLRTNNSFNLNYKINKINLSGNFGFSQNNSYQDLTINRYYYTSENVYNSGFTQNSYNKQRRRGQNAKIGIDYYVDKKSTIGVVFSGFLNPSTSYLTNNAKILDAGNNPTTLIRATNPTEREWLNGSVNANYLYKINDKGQEIFLNADYIKYDSKSNQLLTNSIFNPDNSLINSTVLRSELPAEIAIQSIKADYTLPLNNIGKLEAGVKSSFVNSDNTASFFDVVDGVQTPNYEFSNQFIYKENLNAAYLNYSRQWRSFGVQLGLRLENTNAKGDQLGNPLVQDSSFKLNYSSLFPTLFLSYKLDSTDTHQFGFSAGRRIDRPDYQDLNPFTYPMDRYTYYGGNPFLRPTYSYNAELSHTFKNMFTTTFDYSIAEDLISETNEQRGTIYYSRPGNFGRQIVYGMSINGQFPIAKWWTLQMYAEGKNVIVKSQNYGQTIDEQRWYYYIGPTNQFVITKNLSAELGAFYQSRILSGQFLTISVWSMRAGISQKILKGKGSIKFNLSDALYTHQPGGDIRNIANSAANWLSYLDTRVATFSFSYRFSQGQALNARQSGASDDEKGRVRAN